MLKNRVNLGVKKAVHRLYVLPTDSPFLVLRCPVCGYMAALDLDGGGYAETVAAARHRTALEIQPGKVTNVTCKAAVETLH